MVAAGQSTFEYKLLSEERRDLRFGTDAGTSLLYSRCGSFGCHHQSGSADFVIEPKSCQICLPAEINMSVARCDEFLDSGEFLAAVGLWLLSQFPREQFYILQLSWTMRLELQCV